MDLFVIAGFNFIVSYEKYTLQYSNIEAIMKTMYWTALIRNQNTVLMSTLYIRLLSVRVWNLINLTCLAYI